jgi:cobalt-zinc-cadmium resistance protein CzcA
MHNQPLIWLTAWYQQRLAQLLDRPHIAYAIGGIVLLIVIVLGLSAGREFLPELDEGALWLQVQLPSGVSLEKGSSMAAELRNKLLAHPEVSYVVTQLGRSDEGTDPWTPSHIEVPVGLHPYSKWPHHKTKAEFINQLNAEFAQMPGYIIGISQPIVDNINDLIGGSHSPLALRIYGNDLTEARRIGTHIVAILKTIRGTASASIFQEPPIPQMVIDVDRKKLGRLGIAISDVMRLIQSGLSGYPITVIYNDNRIYNATAVFNKPNKSSREALSNLFVADPNGNPVLLSQIASISYQMGQSNIAHEETQREITVRIDNRNRDLTSYLKEAEQRIANEVTFDKHQFHLQWAGQFESQQRAEKRLLYILAVMLVVMSILLFIQFQKAHLVVLVLGVVPMATLGGLISLHLTGGTINVATAVGFIALFGVSVQNGIIMVTNIRRVRNADDSLIHSVIHGASERLRPVLMTATVASCGMLPAALATGVGTDVQRGLATVVVGGLAVSTLLTLFILPTYYYVLESFLLRFQPPDSTYSESP